MSNQDKKSRQAQELMADFILNALGKGGDAEKSSRVRKLSRDLCFRPKLPGQDEADGEKLENSR